MRDEGRTNSNDASIVHRPSSLVDFLLTILSAVLLILAFPKTDWSILAFFGLVPLFLALDRQPGAKKAFQTAYLTGVLFFGGTLYWFIHVTDLGALLLVLFLALYFGLFGVGYHYLSREPMCTRLWTVPALWTLIEFLRAHFLTGFGWASLGQSQYKNLLLIQVADLTGMYGISFVVVLVNCVLAGMLKALNEDGAARRQLKFCAVIVLCVLAAAGGYGLWRMKTIGAALKEAPTLRVAVVQADIAQEMKWDEAAWPGIMEQYLAVAGAAASEKPDLMIWPETSYPGILWEDNTLFQKLEDFTARTHIPLLVGAVTHEDGNYYNEALFLSGEGKLIGEYRKLHLVPFGEYIPLRNIFPFLSQIVPIADFTPGREYTVLALPKAARKNFSVLICFEDTVAGLARMFVHHGAGFLVNITNDAWFHDTKAPFMHLQSAVLRTVENRRSLVRAANTGVSCLIDPLGRITGCVQDNRGKKTYVRGYALRAIPVYRAATFYTRYGDVFVLVCAAFFLGAALFGKRKEN